MGKEQAVVPSWMILHEGTGQAKVSLVRSPVPLRMILHDGTAWGDYTTERREHMCIPEGTAMRKGSNNKGLILPGYSFSNENLRFFKNDTFYSENNKVMQRPCSSIIIVKKQ